MAFLQCRSILMSSLFRPVNHKHDTCVTKKVIWPNVAILGNLQWLNPIKHFLSSRHTNPKLLCLWALWVGQNLWLPLKHSLVALTKPVVLKTISSYFSPIFHWYMAKCSMPLLTKNANIRILGDRSKVTWCMSQLNCSIAQCQCNDLPRPGFLPLWLMSLYISFDHKYLFRKNKSICCNDTAIFVCRGRSYMKPGGIAFLSAPNNSKSNHI